MEKCNEDEGAKDDVMEVKIGDVPCLVKGISIIYTTLIN